MNSNAQIKKQEDGVFLELTLPQEAFTTDTEVITTQKLGMVRIAEAFFENPDGSALWIDRDLQGHTFSGKIVPGPLQTLQAGKNRLRIWNVRAYGSCI